MPQPHYRRSFRPKAPPPPPPPPPAAKPSLSYDGDRDLWVTLQRVVDTKSGWVKTTRAMATPAGVLVNTCSRKINTNVAAEALCLVPGTKLHRVGNSDWKVVPS